MKSVRYYKSPDDGRVVGIFIGNGFDEYARFPPFVDSEAEKRHIVNAYDVKDPLSERNSKAHITDDEWPLQVILLAREKGSITKPHYHRNERPPQVATRHEILLCQKGSATVGVYTCEGQHLGEAHLKEGDLVILAEGHSLEILEDGTKILEVKQGPFPKTDDADKVKLGIPV